MNVTVETKVTAVKNKLKCRTSQQGGIISNLFRMHLHECAIRCGSLPEQRLKPQSRHCHSERLQQSIFRLLACLVTLNRFRRQPCALIRILAIAWFSTTLECQSEMGVINLALACLISHEIHRLAVRQFFLVKSTLWGLIFNFPHSLWVPSLNKE